MMCDSGALEAIREVATTGGAVAGEAKARRQPIVPLLAASSSLADLRRLLGIAVPECDLPSQLRFAHRRVRAGAHLVSAGQSFESLHVLNSGFMKASLISACGIERVTSFPVKGELLGVDALSADRHVTSLIALTDCDALILPMDLVAQAGRDHPGFGRSLLRLIGSELVREQSMVATVSMPSAEARVAHFLLETGRRMSSIGYSGHEFLLRMTRRDVGNYLSLQVETVSRVLSALAGRGLIVVERRWVRLNDLDGLRALDACGPDPSMQMSVARPAGESWARQQDSSETRVDQLCHPARHLSAEAFP